MKIPIFVRSIALYFLFMFDKLFLSVLFQEKAFRTDPNRISGSYVPKAVLPPLGMKLFTNVAFLLVSCSVFGQIVAENDIRTKPGLTNTTWSNATTNWERCGNPAGCDVTLASAGVGGWTDVTAANVSGATGVTIYIRRNMNSRATAFTLDGSMVISSGVTFSISNTTGSNDFVVSASGSVINNGTISLLNATTSGNKTNFRIEGAINNLGTINNILSNGVLTFNSDVTNSGIINSTGTNGVELNFSGGVAQTISGGTINCSLVQILNATTVNNNAAIIVTGTIAMDGTGNVLDADGSGGGSVILRSTGDNSSLDAAIAALVPEDLITGNITIQRYISQNSNRIYRYLCFPVSGATVSQLQDDFSVTGDFTGASTTEPQGPNPPCNQAFLSSTPSLFTYNSGTNTFDAYPVSPAGTSAPLISNTGYVAFIRNCNTAITVDVTGQVNQGDQTFNIPFGGAFSGEDPNSYSLVGNPYPSPIDWAVMGDLGLLSGSNISTTIQIPDNTSGSLSMIAIDANDGAGSGYVATGQAFWVSTTSSTSFTMTEDVKSAGIATSYYRKKTGVKATKGTLILQLSDGEVFDKTFLKLNASATGEFERNDGPKLENDRFDISTLTSDNVSVIVNAVDTLQDGEIIRLKTKDLVEGNYTLGFDYVDVFSDYYTVTFVDTYTGTETPATSPYSFSVDGNHDSKKTDRFQLVIGRKGNITGSIESLASSIKSYPNPVRNTYHVELPGTFDGSPNLTIFNVVGNQVGTMALARSGSLLTGDYDFGSLPSGLYVVRVSGKSSAINLKVIKK